MISAALAHTGHTKLVSWCWFRRGASVDRPRIDLFVNQHHRKLEKEVGPQ